MTPWSLAMYSLLPSRVRSPLSRTIRFSTRMAAWGAFWYACTFIYQTLRMQYVMRLIRQRAEVDERIDVIPEHLRRSYWTISKDWWRDQQPGWWTDQNPQVLDKEKRQEAVDRVLELHEQAVEELRQERDELMRQYRDRETKR
mmetsp:Transcript_4512/g.17081  ORF Transcript_4512/g.17081 Transcript_4512/m.17081 type:complete len:143 (-) Transcript_4512:6-434(-)